MENENQKKSVCLVTPEQVTNYAYNYIKYCDDIKAGKITNLRKSHESVIDMNLNIPRTQTPANFMDCVKLLRRLDEAITIEKSAFNKESEAYEKLSEFTLEEILRNNVETHHEEILEIKGEYKRETDKCASYISNLKENGVTM